MNKNLRIFYNFLEDYKVYKYFVFFALVMMSMAAYMEITVIVDGINILKQIDDVSKYKAGIRILIWQTIKIVIYCSCIHLLPIVSDYFLTKFYRVCICFYIIKALNINHKLYNEIGPSNIRSIIDRKVFNNVIGFHILVFSFFYSTAFCLMAAFLLLTNFNAYVFVYSLSSILLVLAVVIPVANLRNKYRLIYTQKYDQVIRVIYRVIGNYDIIKANNKEEAEATNMDVYLQRIATYGVICSSLVALGGFLSRIIVIIPNGFFFYYVITGSQYFNIKTAGGFVLFNKLFCALKSRLVYLKDEYTKLQSYYTDIKNNDWDEIQCDIENMAMYFKFQKEDANKEIEFKNIEQTVPLMPEQASPPLRSISREYKDFEIIKKSTIETQEESRKRDPFDGDEHFTFKKHIKFQEFALFINDRILINPVNLKINKGDKVGLVGKNGTGKSTLLGVFLRFRDYKGAIFIDDVEMKNIYKVDQRNKISYIPQTPGILCGTISDNLLYNNKNLNDVNLLKLCESYDMKFNDLEKDVGENGKFMSGGEKQRISFLRGVIKNGDLFILDEPTANMDPKSELNLIEKLHTHLYDKTVIAIIHNHALLKKFDKIIGIFNNEIKVYNGFEEFSLESHLY